MTNEQALTYLLIGFSAGILGVLWELNRNHTKLKSTDDQVLRRGIENSIILGRLGVALGILIDVFLVYVFIWIQTLGNKGPTHEEMCQIAFGIFGPALILLSLYRKKLKQRLSAAKDQSTKRPIEMRLTTNTVYIVCSYAVLFFHLAQYIRILMGWADYPS